MSDENEDVLEEEFDVKKVKEVLVDIEDGDDTIIDPLLLVDIDPEEVDDEDTFSAYQADDDAAEFLY